MENEKIQPGDKFISPHVYDPDLTQTLKKCWEYNVDGEMNNANLILKPFKTCKLENFLQKPLGTYDLRGELLSVHTRKRGNDLMKLEESVCDLQDITPDQSYSQNVECIKQFCTEMLTDFKPWLTQVTGHELSEKMSIRTSIYRDTDFLLCHNDLVEDRIIAFILYLSKDWKEEYGGQLNLFKSHNGIPTKINRSLIPEFNSLLFFEVSHFSFHSVSEILKNVSRFSVNGWFHGKVTSLNLPSRIEPVAISQLLTAQDNLSTFIVQTRIRNSTFLEIVNKVIEVTSFCGIKNYLIENQYEKLLQDITSDEIKWYSVGPPDQRNYEVAMNSTLPELLCRFCRVFQTTQFGELLKKYTHLELVPSKAKSKMTNPTFRVELQRWRQGCYTVLHDGYVKDKEDVKEPEMEDSEDEQTAKSRRKENGSKSKSTDYTVKDMLQDIIVDSNDISKILPFLPASVTDALKEDEVKEKSEAQRENEPGPSGTSRTSDGPPPSKKSRCDDGMKDDESNDEDEDDGNLETQSEVKGTLDVVMYFHAANAPEDTMLNYVDPGTEDGVFLTLPIQDNCLFLVYRQEGVVRHHEYVNHYCKGNFYALVCSYKE